MKNARAPRALTHFQFRTSVLFVLSYFGSEPEHRAQVPRPRDGRRRGGLQHHHAAVGLGDAPHHERHRLVLHHRTPPGVIRLSAPRQHAKAPHAVAAMAEGAGDTWHRLLVLGPEPGTERHLIPTGTRDFPFSTSGCRRPRSP